MKIRTDFVTNSSSSSFVVRLKFELKNRKCIEFLERANSGEGKGFDALYVTVSPKQLAMADSVQTLINLLKNNVVDGDPVEGYLDDKHEDGQARIFDDTDIRTCRRRKDETHWEHERYVKASEFIEELAEIGSVDDIKRVSITGDRTNRDVRQYETYVYDKSKDKYTGIVFGYFDEAFYCNGGASGGIAFPYDGVTVKRINKSSKLPDERGLGLDTSGITEDFNWKKWYGNVREGTLDDAALAKLFESHEENLRISTRKINNTSTPVDDNVLTKPLAFKLVHTRTGNRKANSDKIHVGDVLRVEHNLPGDYFYFVADVGEIGAISSSSWLNRVLKAGVSYHAEVAHVVSYSQLENEKKAPVITVKLQLELTDKELKTLLGTDFVPQGIYGVY